MDVKEEYIAAFTEFKNYCLQHARNNSMSVSFYVSNNGREAIASFTKGGLAKYDVSYLLARYKKGVISDDLNAIFERALDVNPKK